MARTNYVKSARARKEGRDPRKCCTCGQPILVGSPYYWNQPSRFSARFNWHASCNAPRPSALEPNEKRSTAMAAVEQANDDLDTYRGVEIEVGGEVTLVDDVQGVLNQLAEGLREAAEMWRESAQAIEDGFQHPTSQSDEYNEFADQLEQAADSLEYVDFPDMPTEEDIDTGVAEHERQTLEELLEAWRDEVLDAADTAVNDAEGDLP